MPSAPNGMMASATVPYVSAGPTASEAGQVSRPVRATIAPGSTSNKTAISTPKAKLTGLVWRPR